MSVAAVRCGTCETVATRRSCWSGANGDHLGPERPHHRVDQRERRGRSVVRRGQDPGGAVEQVSACTVGPERLRAGHRMPADERGVIHGGHDRRLDAADIGHHAAAGERCAGHLRCRSHRHGDEGDLGVGIRADRVERAQLRGLGAPWRRRRRRRSRASRGSQGEADGRADEPGPDHRGAARRGARHPGRSSRSARASSR